MHLFSKILYSLSINLAGLASASTVPIPQSPFLQPDPDDERGGASSSSAAAATAYDDSFSKTDDGEAIIVEVISNQEVADDTGVGGGAEYSDDGGVRDNIPTTITAVEKNSAEKPISSSSAIVGVKRRKKQQLPVHAALDEKRCRGACGSSSRCLSSTRDFQDQLIHCTNYYERMKCPLWVGPNCAEAFHSYKCRICTLIDSNRSARYYF